MKVMNINTYKIIGKNCYGEEKVNRLKMIGIKKCEKFYSDSKSDEPLKKIAKSSFLVKGEKITLPEFSAQEPINDEYKKIFDAACGNYQMPLGTPITVGKRNIQNGTEYKFTVENKDQDGNASQSTIYITAENGAEPEFTQVVR